MLDSDTKRRIDTARDILVGKVPDPKSQVEQITIALIYKFMDDMDAESEEFGGKRSFFAGEFARYGWTKLMRGGLGGHETLNLYAEAIAKMPENPGIPRLFRDIFNNAYLPYRDPETLRAFLKVIDEFTYDHSERLGDAFEYLLSVLGSQGDAGQFRTPRHIIDFIVSIIDPKKGETVLDPACGTAGFLISSYKHILAANTDPQGGSTLTPDDKGRLAANFKGYDISPDMVRLSLVNLYLHGFADPHIFEYDTLTSEERWNEYADVILANPPFMSPKGGIRPHNRFSVQSKRSEVLFVDYMAEHLMPSGRAGIIVPEGIIFQSQNAYKQLRKMLVEEYLVAVVSLPAGVFNPYSGVKTSILILDKSLAKKTDRVAFFKVESDGFDLGAQRRPIDKNDLPKTQAEIAEYLRRMRAEEPVDDFETTLGLLAEKGKIAANGDYNLSGERYRERETPLADYPTVPIGSVSDLIGGGTPSRQNESYWTDGSVKWISSKHIGADGQIVGHELISHEAVDKTSTKIAPKGSTIIVTRVSVGKFAYADSDYAVNQDLTALITKDRDLLSPEYLRAIAPQIAHVVDRYAQGIGVRGVTRAFFFQFQIPLPPLEVQKEIVAEIEGYQKVIDGARAVVDNYRPQIVVDPDWPMVELGEVFKLSSGRGLTRAQMENGPFPVYGGNGISGFHSEYFVEESSIVIGRVGAYCGAVHIADPKAWVSDNGLYVTTYKREINQRFLAQVLTQLKLNQFAKVGGQPSISQTTVYECRIPVPPLNTQQAIVTEIKAEQALVEANHELIERFEQKIQTTIGRVWGEDKSASS